MKSNMNKFVKDLNTKMQTIESKMQVTRTSLDQINQNRAEEDRLASLQRSRDDDPEFQSTMQMLMQTLKQQQ